MAEADSQAPIPVTVVAGFLGSGKTTLLNRMLHARQSSEKVAVIVNEFGAVGIDGALVEGGEQFVELDNGCLCCALNEDLSQTLQAIVARGGIDRILIETTGVADPLPVAWTATRPEVAAALRLDAIVVLLDAAHGPEVLRDYAEARMQVERADVVLVSKVDLVTDKGLRAATAAQQVQPHAPVLFAGGEDIPFEALFGSRRDGEQGSVLPRALHAPGDSHAHAGDDIQCITWQAPTDGPAIDERRAETFAYEIPARVVRFKALLQVNAKEGPWMLIHGVSGRVDLRFLTPARPPLVHVWVFFGRALDAYSLASLCEAALRPERP